MAGYSGTPLVKKLGIKEGSRVALVGSPPGMDKTIGALPDGSTLDSGLTGPSYDVIVLFARQAAELAQRLPEARARLDKAGGLWVAWPKKASKVATDVTEGVVRGMGLEAKLVDNKVCAIDETWSGLRLVVRVKDR